MVISNRKTYCSKIKDICKVPIFLLKSCYGECEPATNWYQTMRLALTEKIDVWALGCTIFEIYRGWPLFQHNGLEEHLVILQWLFQRSIPSTMLFEYYRRNVKPVDSDELDPPPEKRAKMGTPDYDAIYTTNCDLPIPQQAMIDGLKAIHYGPEIDLIRYLGIPRSDEEEIVHKLIIETLKILPVCRPSLRELLRDFFNSV
ncbi:unnamed protein product, partial [Mesorhabditis belari]|uniref:Protein kinase domain-containing protein n=1 Tax=Mesorhabditis belari TaxID=2138241 RepID=A0AAF3EMC6_9BILA